MGSMCIETTGTWYRLTWPDYWLYRASSTDQPSTQLRAKVKCCRSHGHFGCRITYYLTSQLLSRVITGQHPRPTSIFVLWSLFPLQGWSPNILILLLKWSGWLSLPRNYITHHSIMHWIQWIPDSTDLF